MLALDKAAGLQNICVAVLAAMGSLALVACSTATPVAKTAPVAKSADVAGPLVSETGFTLTDNVQIEKSGVPEHPAVRSCKPGAAPATTARAVVDRRSTQP